jgi:hypothetical protein
MRDMTEHEIIARLAVHLSQNARCYFSRISVKAIHQQQLRDYFRSHRVPTSKIARKFAATGWDLTGTITWNEGQRKKLFIEAKGGTVKYGIYSAFGQLMAELRRPSYFYGLAFPRSWRAKVQQRLCDEAGHLKPGFHALHRHLREKGGQLHFFFVGGSTNPEMISIDALAKDFRRRQGDHAGITV